jgi:hypothetical protein
MTPALVLSLVVAVLALAYAAIWLWAHIAGDFRRARSARNGLAAHLAFSAAFLVVLGIAP